MVKTNSRHNDSISTLGWGAGKKPEEAETELKFVDGWMEIQCLQVYTARFDLLGRLLGTTGGSTILRTENVFRSQALSVEICDRSKIVSVLLRTSCAYIRLLGRPPVTTTAALECGELDSCSCDHKLDMGFTSPRD